MKQSSFRSIRVFLSWLCGQQGIRLLPWNKETLAISKNNGKFTFYVYREWLYSSDPEIFDILEGGFYHEALGHGRNTTFESYSEAENSGVIKWNSFSKGVCNIFEDIFIEREAANIYPSVPAAILRTVELLSDRGFFGNPEDFAEMNESCCLMNGLLNFCRGELLPGQGQFLQANMDAATPVLQERLGLVWDRVWDIAKECNNSLCTMDNIILTAKVMDIVQSIAEAESEEGSDEAAGESTSDSSNPGDASASGKATDRDIAVAKAILSQLDDESLSKIGELTESVNAAVAQSISEAGGCTGYDIEEVPSQYAEISPEGLRIAAIVQSASSDLEELLMSETYVRRENVERGNRIDRSSLVRGAAGFTSRIFEREGKGEALSTAVYGLFDFSGSMYSGFMENSMAGIDAVNGVMYGLGDIFDEFEVPYEFAAYSDRYMTYKPFDANGEMLRRGKKVAELRGGTVTGGAVDIALGRLVMRNERRKLLIVVTDGDTGDIERLVSCYNSAKYMGMEIASVMLGDVVIPQIEQLAHETAFKATLTNKVSGLGRFIVNQIKSSIK